MTTLRRRWRRTRSRFIAAGAILGYHRVARTGSDPFHLCVTPEHFAEQLEVVRHNAHPVTLERLVQAVQNRRSLRGAVAVTFDDGYADNLHAAKPILERLDVPATVHVVAGALGRRFWWDELAAAYGSDRQGLARAHRELLSAPPAVRLRAIARLPAHADGASTATARALTGDEALELARDGLVSIGAHSVTHSVLTALSLAGQREEIFGSKTALEKLLARPVEAFAYPHGQASRRTRMLVREAGFRWASGNRFGAVSRRSDPYAVPRLWVPDLDGDQFEKWLSEWLPNWRGDEPA